LIAAGIVACGLARLRGLCGLRGGLRGRLRGCAARLRGCAARGRRLRKGPPRCGADGKEEADEDARPQKPKKARRLVP